jgi:small subunit ribosomal protein S4
MPTGDKLLELLERRLDNAVFRAGFAPNTVAARQLVRHRHILLNGERVNIPSIRIRPGDTLTLHGKAGQIPMVLESLKEPALTRPEWLTFDESLRSAQVSRMPMADEVPFPVDVQQVVEYYAQRL